MLGIASAARLSWPDYSVSGQSQTLPFFLLLERSQKTEKEIRFLLTPFIVDKRVVKTRTKTWSFEGLKWMAARQIKNHSWLLRHWASFLSILTNWVLVLCSGGLWQQSDTLFFVLLTVAAPQELFVQPDERQEKGVRGCRRGAGQGPAFIALQFNEFGSSLDITSKRRKMDKCGKHWRPECSCGCNAVRTFLQAH